MAGPGRFGSAGDRAEIVERITRMETAIGRLWDSALGLFKCFDLVGGAAIPVGISAGLLPLFAGAASAGGWPATTRCVTRGGPPPPRRP